MKGNHRAWCKGSPRFVASSLLCSGKFCTILLVILYMEVCIKEKMSKWVRRRRGIGISGWKGTRRKFTLFIFVSKEKKNFSEKKAWSFDVPANLLLLSSRARKILVIVSRRIEVSIRKRFLGREKEGKGEIEEYGEGVAKRLEPNWNST